MEEKEIKVEFSPEGELTEEQKEKLRSQLESKVVEAISGERARVEGVSVAAKIEFRETPVTKAETKIPVPLPKTKTKESGIA
jgi:hypothetical protein